MSCCFKTKLTFTDSSTFCTKVCFDKNDGFCLSFDSSTGVRHSTYEGPYEVDPTFSDIILNTKQKLMSDDVLVNEIAVHRVTNLSGGLTVTIGSVGGI